MSAEDVQVRDNTNLSAPSDDPKAYDWRNHTHRDRRALASRWWDMIEARDPLVLTDSYANEAFADRVDAQRQARFYAGVPIRTVAGLALGTS